MKGLYCPWLVNLISLVSVASYIPNVFHDQLTASLITAAQLRRASISFQKLYCTGPHSVYIVLKRHCYVDYKFIIKLVNIFRNE